MQAGPAAPERIVHHGFVNLPFTSALCLLGRLGGPQDTELLIWVAENGEAMAEKMPVASNAYFRVSGDWAFQFVSLAVSSLVKLAGRYPLAQVDNWLQNWLENETTILKTVAQTTTLYTRDSSKEIGNGTTKPVADCPDVMASSDEWIETTDKVFLLSEADLFGTYNGEATTDARDYTYNGTRLTPNRSQRMFDDHGHNASYAWLRNAYSNSDRHDYQPNTPVASTARWLYMAGVRYDGYTTTYTTTTGFPDSYVTQDDNYVLPALWIDFSMD